MNTELTENIKPGLNIQIHICFVKTQSQKVYNDELRVELGLGPNEFKLRDSNSLSSNARARVAPDYSETP